MADKDLVEVPEKLSKWFTPDVWKHMSYYERKRMLNVLENYHTLTSLGINIPKQDFMYPILHKTPRNSTQKISVNIKNKVTEKSKEQDQCSFRDACEVSSVQHNCRKPIPYELRKRNAKRYREDSSSDDEDDYMFCDECNREWFGDCPSHGPLTHVMDTQVPMYPLDSERAAKTLPNIFRIGPSAIRKAGLGVWTTTSVLPRTVFGPYEGSLTETDNEEGYCWLVWKKGRPSEFIDASNSSISNWMRFVNCSRHEDEQNLVAFQYKRKIYYRTTRLILPHVELLVWYGEEFGKSLGIDEKKYHVNKQSSGEVHCCSTCRLSFSSAAYRDRHHSYCRRRSKPPSKVSCGTAMKPVHGVLSKEINSGSDAGLRNCSTKSYSCKIQDNTNPITCIHLDPCSQAHCGKQDFKCNYLNKTFAKQGNDCGTNMDGLQPTKNDTHISSGLATYAVKDKMECLDSGKVYHETFSGTSNHNNHERIHTGKRPYKCGTCNKTYSHARNLHSHERIHTGERPYKCSTCNKTFSRASVLHSHERIHTGERPYKCSTCNKAFSQVSYLHTHERIHTGKRPYKCSTCNKAFSAASTLHTHERIHTGKRPYKCSTCNKAFFQASNLHTHERIHTGKRPYKCSTCNKAFSAASTLHTHERIHTGKRPYKCSTCNKAFFQASNLHTHERIHTGERPYKCNTCNKAFSQATDLRLHEGIHTGKRPYKCNTCNKAFSDPSYLYRHARIHTGERPYKCSTCNKAFSDASNLHTHELIHTGKRPYKCSTCNKAFLWPSNLHRHEQIHTRNVNRSASHVRRSSLI